MYAMNIDITNGETMEVKNFFPQVYAIRTSDDIIAIASDLLFHDNNSVEEAKESVKSAKESDAIKILKYILDNIFCRNGKRKSAFTIVVENYYVDPIYRDSYYIHYAAKHFLYARYCTRLFFLDLVESNPENILKLSESELNTKIIGVSTIRPASDQSYIIGRTLLNPSFFVNLKNDFICTTSFKVSMFGKRFSIKAFPYMMQDAEVITCAETTILHLLDYFSNKYSLYRATLPNELAQIEELSAEQRIVPSQGLSYTTISHILTELNFYPRLYGFDESTISKKRKRIMHYYIDSAIPIAVSLSPTDSNKLAHSIVGIGVKSEIEDVNSVGKTKLGNYYFLDSADLFKKYIVMNDSSAPYTEMNFIDTEYSKIILGKLPYEFSMNSLIAPLSKRMFLNSEDACTILLNILSDPIMGLATTLDNIGNEYLNKELGKTAENPIVYRIFLSRGSGFKRKRSSSISDTLPEIAKIYSSIPLPNFVWVCELFSYNSFKEEQALGEIVIDATANNTAGISSVLLINYPHRFAYRLPDEPIECLYDRFAFENNEIWEKIPSYKHGKN